MLVLRGHKLSLFLVFFVGLLACRHLFAADTLLRKIGDAEERYYNEVSKLGPTATQEQLKKARKDSFAEAKEAYDSEKAKVMKAYDTEATKSLKNRLNTGILSSIKDAINDLISGKPDSDPAHVAGSDPGVSKNSSGSLFDAPSEITSTGGNNPSDPGAGPANSDSAGKKSSYSRSSRTPVEGEGSAGAQSVDFGIKRQPASDSDKSAPSQSVPVSSDGIIQRK
jgi:hypothetical protein